MIDIYNSTFFKETVGKRENVRTAFETHVKENKGLFYAMLFDITTHRSLLVVLEKKCTDRIQQIHHWLFPLRRLDCGRQIEFEHRLAYGIFAPKDKMRFHHLRWLDQLSEYLLAYFTYH